MVRVVDPSQRLGSRAAAAIHPAGQGARGAASSRDRFAGVRRLFAQSLAEERDQRRFFLWLPVAAGAGVLLYFTADTEPSLLASAALAALFAAAAFWARERRATFMAMLALACVFGGLASSAAREAT